MRPVDAWRLLHADEAPASRELREAARTAAALPLELRWPWLAPVVAHARHPDPAVRRAVLACTAGARGLAALRVVHAGLEDGDPGVRAAALEHGAELLRAEDSLLLCALASEHEDVRRGALAAAADHQVALWLRGLGTDDLADAVIERVWRLDRPADQAFRLLQHVEAGHLDPGISTTILLHAPWTPPLAGMLAPLVPARVPGTAPREVGALSPWVAHQRRTADPLDRVLELVGQGDEERAAAALAPVFAAAAAGELGDGPRQRLSASALVELDRGLRSEHPIDQLGPSAVLVALAAVAAPVVLLWPALSVEVRGRAAGILGGVAGLDLDVPVPELLAALLPDGVSPSPPVEPGEPQLSPAPPPPSDLGLLRALQRISAAPVLPWVAAPESRQHLAEAVAQAPDVGAQLLLDAPAEAEDTVSAVAAALVRRAGAGDDGAVEVLATLLGRASPWFARVRAAHLPVPVLARILARGGRFLPQGDEGVDVVHAALEVAGPADRTSLQALARVLREGQLDGALLRALILREAAAHPPRVFVAALGQEGCARLAALDSALPLLTGSVAAALAEQMPAAWDDPMLAAWRAPLTPAPPDPLLAVPAPGRRRRVSATKAMRLRTCRADALDKVARFALAAPARGLCAPLLARTPPALPAPRICAAALLSDDDPAEVALVLARYGAEDPDGRAALDRLMARALRDRPLGPAAAAWLHRWDGPRAQLEAWLAGPGPRLVDLLDRALSWQGPALRGAAWEAGARLVEAWRRRGGRRLHDAGPAELAALAVHALAAPPPGDRGVLGFPAHRGDGDRVRRAAARIVAALRAWGLDLSPWRVAVHGVLPRLDRGTRMHLSPWLPEALPPPPPPVAVRPPAPVAVHALETLIREGTDPTELAAVLPLALPGAVALAAQRLTTLPDGPDHLRAALRSGVPHPERISPWLSSTGAATLADVAVAVDPACRLHLALCVAEAGGDAAVAALDWILEVVAQPAPAGATWLPGDVLQRLQVAAIGCEAFGLDRLAVGLLGVHEAPPLRFAVERLQDDPATHGEALLGVLEARPQVAPGLTDALALRLWSAGIAAALPWVVVAGLRAGTSRLPHWADGLPADAVVSACVSGLCVGERVVPVEALLAPVRSPGLPWRTRQAAALAMLQDVREGEVKKKLVPVLSGGGAAWRSTRRVAELFQWGRRQALGLLGRRYEVRAILDGALGWTRLHERVVHVNPTPVLRGERDGEAIVRGLIVHELGHHRYNTDEEGDQANATASREGLHSLLNLVQDEHLERNLRSLDPDWGDDLKKLAAWAFQHARRAEPVDRLRASLGPHLLPVLRRVPLAPGREADTVALGTGALLQALARHGSGFARFVRALRMGRPDRGAGDPRIARALALFGTQPDGGAFRDAGNLRLLEIARELREIFGAEADQLGSVDLHGTAAGQAGDGFGAGEAVTSEQISDEVIRLDRVQSAEERARGGEGRPAGGSGGPDVLVTGPDEAFDVIEEVEILPYEPVEAAALAREVARPARLLREDLAHLGLATRVVKPRVAGHRLDRGRLQALALRRDPRVLQRRTRVLDSDLFVGIVVDCSGSMHGARMVRARRMAALVAEACRPLDGVDARIFGFTDRVIHDAGTDRQCAAHALVADGGNNDAAGLWHAAKVARRSPRSGKLLVMISDGLPTECTTTALRALVVQLQRRMGIVCAQVAVHPLREQCFDHYVEVLDDDVDDAVRAFGRTVARLVRATLTG